MGLSRLFSWIPFLGSGVRRLRQDRPDNCVQTVLAMAIGVPTDVIEDEAGTSGALTIGETIDLLSRFGIESRRVHSRLLAEFWSAFYRMSGGRKMRGLAFALPRDGERIGHAYFVLGRRVYDPATGRIRRLTQRVVRRLDLFAIFPDDLDSHPESVRVKQKVGR